MPRIQRPYYNLHQLTLGQYTDGNEFILADGSIYVGSYYILPTGQRFTGFRPETTSVELFELKLNPTEDILKYNQLTGSEINRYVMPISYQPIPNNDDYKRSYIERFFVQKRNSPLNSILEIDGQQFNSINTLNRPGINGVLWNKLKLEWKISMLPKEDIYYLNQRQIEKNLLNFPGLNTFITNPMEFYR